MDLLYFLQTDLFILSSLRRGNKDSIRRDLHRQKLVFICVAYLLKSKKGIKPQAYTMKCVYLRSSTTNVSAPALKGKAQPSWQKEKEQRGGRGQGQLLLLPKNPGNHSITLGF